jgi:IS30 family transposase
MTWDHGTEMARHNDITDTLGIPIYFCDSHAPWQRGSTRTPTACSASTFPKEIVLTLHDPQHLRAVENEINRRPRQVLANRAPADLLEALLPPRTSHRCDV